MREPKRPRKKGTAIVPVVHDFFGMFVRHYVDPSDGEPRWVLSDAAKILVYRDAADASRILDADERGSVCLMTPGGAQRLLVVTEGGLSHLVIRSKKPRAKVFRSWLKEAVMPEIRRTGRDEGEGVLGPAGRIRSRTGPGSQEKGPG